MELIPDIGTLNNLIQEYLIKNTVTNSYVMADAYTSHITERRLFYFATGHNACILLERSDYYQLYYFINDKDELTVPDTDCPVMMEILYRGESQRPGEIIAYWEKAGFRQHLTRDVLSASYSNLVIPSVDNAKIDIKYAETEREAVYSKELIEQTFDKYTGDVLSIGETQSYLVKKNILCAYLEGSLCGILQFELKNNVVWLGHIAVSPEFRGYGIANALVKKYIVDNAISPATRYQLWVIQDNATAVSLYHKFGFVYGNKSSASMLRD